MSIFLYSRDDCSLCDKAEALLAEAGFSKHYQKVEIDTDLELLQRYRDQIPVLYKEETGEKLAWPFTASQARTLIDG